MINTTNANPKGRVSEEDWNILLQHPQIKFIASHSSFLNHHEQNIDEKITQLGAILQTATQCLIRPTQFGFQIHTIPIEDADPNWNPSRNHQKFKDLADKVTQQALFIFAMKSKDKGLLSNISLNQLPKAAIHGGLTIASMHQDISILKALIPYAENEYLQATFEDSMNVREETTVQECLLENAQINADEYLRIERGFEWRRELIPTILKSGKYSKRSPEIFLLAAKANNDSKTVEKFLSSPDFPLNSLQVVHGTVKKSQVHFEAFRRFPVKMEGCLFQTDINKKARNEYVRNLLNQDCKDEPVSDSSAFLRKIEQKLQARRADNPEVNRSFSAVFDHLTKPV